jgi:hypothetical protein
MCYSIERNGEDDEDSEGEYFVNGRKYQVRSVHRSSINPSSLARILVDIDPTPASASITSVAPSSAKTSRRQSTQPKKSGAGTLDPMSCLLCASRRISCGRTGYVTTPTWGI